MNGVIVYQYDGEPFDLEQLEEERRQMMAKVVIVRDLADVLGRDRSSLTKTLRKNEIELFKVRDPVTDQQVLAVMADEVEYIKSLFESEHDIVDPKELI